MNLWRMLFAGGLMVVLLIGKNGFAAEPAFSTEPTTNQGRKWRIAYYEGGGYLDYYHHLRAAVKGLMDLGWIEDTPIPEDENKDTGALWRWLVHGAKSDYLSFLDDGFYSARWDSRARITLREQLIHRLSGQQDIDLIIAMGTWAGKDLASNRHDIPTLVMSSSDPVGSGVVKSIDDSGYEHLHARVDPSRHERQVRVFHDIIGFKKLGVAYENTVIGRSYAAIDKVETVARERGFEVLRCYTQSDIADQAQAEQSVIHCFEKLAQQVDALYVTSQGGVTARSIPALVKIANRYRIPTFSQLGSEEVRQGVLLSLSNPEYASIGLFFASGMAKIMNGAIPRQLNQLFEDEQSISINLKTAEVIGLYLHADVLAAADEIYQQIE